MAKLDNIIALGAALSGSKGDVNNLMNQLPGALAQIHIANEESAKEEKRYNDVLEMEVQKNIKEEKRYNIALDSEILQSLGNISDPIARKAAYSNYNTNSDVGAQIKNAGVTGAQSQIDNTTSYNNQYKDLEKIIKTGRDGAGNTYTEEEKETKLQEFRLQTSSNPYQGPRFDSLLLGLETDLDENKTELAVKDMVSIFEKDPAQAERYIQTLTTPGVSETIKAQVLKQLFPKDASLTAQDLQNGYKLLEQLGGTAYRNEHPLFRPFGKFLAEKTTKQMGFLGELKPNLYAGYKVTQNRANKGKDINEVIENVRNQFADDLNPPTDEELFQILLTTDLIEKVI